MTQPRRGGHTYVPKARSDSRRATSMNTNTQNNNAAMQQTAGTMALMVTAYTPTAPPINALAAPRRSLWPPLMMILLLLYYFIRNWLVYKIQIQICKKTNLQILL